MAKKSKAMRINNGALDAGCRCSFLSFFLFVFGSRVSPSPVGWGVGSVGEMGGTSAARASSVDMGGEERDVMHCLSVVCLGVCVCLCVCVLCVCVSIRDVPGVRDLSLCARVRPHCLSVCRSVCMSTCPYIRISVCF